MKVSVINIGNSKGIRIPKSVLSQCHIDDEVDMEVKNSEIILKPLKKVPRNNWESQFLKEVKNIGKSEIFIPDSNLSEIRDWEW